MNKNSVVDIINKAGFELVTHTSPRKYDYD